MRKSVSFWSAPARRCGWTIPSLFLLRSHLGLSISLTLSSGSCSRRSLLLVVELRQLGFPGAVSLAKCRAGLSRLVAIQVLLSPSRTGFKSVVPTAPMVAGTEHESYNAFDLPTLLWPTLA